MFSLSSLQISLKMWTGKGWTWPCALRDLISKNKTKKATCVSNTLPKQYRISVCDGRGEDAGETHTLLRNGLGSPWGLSLSCSPPQGMGFTPHPASTQHQETASGIKKENQNKTKHNTLYWNKEAGFVPEDATLRNATEDSNPFQAS